MTQRSRRRRGEASLTRFAWLALLLHAACWLTFRIADPPSAPLRGLIARAPDAAVDFEIELSEPEHELIVPGVPSKRTAVALPQRTHRTVAPKQIGEAEADGDEGAIAELEATDQEEEAPSRFPELLTREQLGIGETNPWLEARPALQPSKKRAQSRLQRSLTQALVERDLDLGVGPAGPILTAIRRISLRELHVVNTAATIVALIDSQGNLIGLDVTDVDADHKSWQRVAAQTLESLQGKKLLANAGKHRTRLTLRVESREQLPSGAAPGPKVTLFGQTLKEGGGDRAHHIEILKPELKLEMVEVPGSDRKPMKLPQIRFMIIPFSAPFEPADWGAPAQRSVSARVDKIDVLPETNSGN